jgi:diguanylate cyclase (GGDEF)-like protein
MANQYYLTKLPNRKKIRDTVKKYQEEVHQGEYELSMCMIDLDNLKRINDNYGHIKGDLVLKTLGQILDEHSKSFDLIGRLSGDEFFIVSKNIEQRQFKEIIEDILFKFENHQDIKEYKPSFSYGISVMRKDDEYYDKVKEADDLMYQRKREKKKL